MDERIDSGFILSFDEMRILLHSMEVRAVEGIYMPEKKFTEADIILALHHMAQRNIITPKESGFSIRQELVEILGVIENHYETAVLGEEKCDGTTYFCYLGKGQIVVSERYWKKADTIKLRMFKPEAFEQWKEQVADDNCGDRSPYDGEVI